MIILYTLTAALNAITFAEKIVFLAICEYVFYIFGKLISLFLQQASCSNVFSLCSSVSSFSSYCYYCCHYVIVINYDCCIPSKPTHAKHYYSGNIQYPAIILKVSLGMCVYLGGGGGGIERDGVLRRTI